jgi:hypothetical protein
MARIDRPHQVPETAPDGREPGGREASAARGAVLATPSARHEYALAYRATVEAVYTEAALSAGARRGGGRPSADDAEAARPVMAERYPALYRKSPDQPPHVEGPGEHPASWLAGIYPGRDRHQRPNNCGECARATDSTWHGTPVAAADLIRKTGGERPAIMSEWAGRSPEPAGMAEIERRLTQLGPGSSAIIGFDRDGGPGHWFNAVNHEGKILAVDGQSARYEDWPPSRDGLGFDEREMTYSDAIYFTPDGKAAQNDHQ